MSDKKKKLENKYGEIFGYARVSTTQQHEDRQMIALEEYGVDPSHIFLDKFSGKSFNRPAYKKMLRILRKGDIIVIKSIDRLGRNYQDIIDQWRMITIDIGCGIHVLDMPILNTSGDPEDLTSKFITDMMLQVLSFVAQNERETTIKRQQEGIAAAKRRRKIKIGRPKKKMPYDFWSIYLAWKSGKYKSSDLWRYCHEMWGTCNRTFYRRLNELDQRFGDLSYKSLQNLILSEELFDGIEYDNERLECGIEYYNPYILHNPEKEKAAKEKKKLELMESETDADDEEIKRIEKMILDRRQKEFRDRFNIPDPDDMPTKLITRKVDKESFNYIAHNHSKNSGMDQAIDLKPDDSPQIPDIVRTDPQKPMKTIIIT